MQVNIQNLIDDGKCYETVRKLRWPDGVDYPSCESKEIVKRGFDDTESPANAMNAKTVTHALMISPTPFLLAIINP